jgi:hypothetical protein
MVGATRDLGGRASSRAGGGVPIWKYRSFDIGSHTCGAGGRAPSKAQSQASVAVDNSPDRVESVPFETIIHVAKDGFTFSHWNIPDEFP